MADQMIFKRYELKYLLSPEMDRAIRIAMMEHMVPDIYGRNTNLSLYLDTPDFLLVRRSIESPVYKEKLRIRSYGTVDPEDKVFVELKKKYRKVVYKRRVALTEDETNAWIKGSCLPADSQIVREIDYSRRLYPQLAPRMLLSYDRQAFYAKENQDFRLTFDRNILWRMEDLNLHSPVRGRPLLKDGQVLMEIKTGAAIPLWLVEVLSREKIYRSSFSKYGRAYEELMRKNKPGGQAYWMPPIPGGQGFLPEQELRNSLPAPTEHEERRHDNDIAV